MKPKFLAVLILQLIFLNGRGQADSLTIESYTNEIYSWIFNNYIYKLQQPNFRKESTTIAIRETPKYFKTIIEYLEEKIFDSYKGVQKETFDAFKSKIADPIHFENLNVPGFSIYIFNEAAFPSWNDLIENYKNWNRKFIEFTPIGFNNDFNQAMLYFGYDDGFIGGGIVLIFEHKRNKWKLKSQIGVWAF